MQKFISSFKSVFSIEDANSNEIKTVDRECIAIDQSGNLGSLYDAYHDAITEKLNFNCKPHSTISKEPAKCDIYNGHTGETQNLLQMIDIDRALRLSIMLKMIQPVGIASIINYSHSINKYTRFLYFRDETRIESCYNDLIKRIKSDKLRVHHASATHIITEIVWGIQVVVVLQLPSDNEANIDHLLEQIRQNLINNECHVVMTSKEKSLFDQILSTTVYSNIPSLTKLTKLDDVYQTICRMRRSIDEHRRLKYSLNLIQPLYPEQNGNNAKNIGLDEEKIENFENHLLQQLSAFKVLQLRLDHELPELLQGKLEERLLDARQSFSAIKKFYDNNIEQVQNLMINLRKGRDVLNSIDEVLSSDVQATVNDSLHRLIISLDKLALKGKLIKQLQNDGFQYCNVAQLGIDQKCNEQLVKDMLFKNESNKVIWCSSDIQKEQSQQQWDLLRSQMIDSRLQNAQLNLVYADFSYSTWTLKKMQILSPKEQLPNRSESTSKASSINTKRKAPSPPLSSSHEYINILLLGESGVGKSTFINAFANYLHFDTLQQAQSGQPIVIIPVSFLITVNDNFDEQLVNFGETDSNEDHTKSGQSVTQQCRSYVFDISRDKKLRIIDTPGFSDTRGDNQDQINMKVIFSFLNNLTHLNSICLLFKPNVGQLNPFLYSCFTQLFEYFGEKIRDRFIFCFTNARSTFFAPGDTRPLLTSFFNSFPVKNIPLERKNTFCFDSESFRYLVALQKAIKFNENDEKEFDNSWLRSVEESKRLRDFLCDRAHPYNKSVEWQSVQEAQFQINCMIRPILEAIRNILRNILLCVVNSMLELKAICVKLATMICYSCERTLEKHGGCWVLSDHLHSSPNMVSFAIINIQIMPYEDNFFPLFSH
jgi:anion-transporting  ArsA/GET3 family ATPase